MNRVIVPVGLADHILANGIDYWFSNDHPNSASSLEVQLRYARTFAEGDTIYIFACPAIEEYVERARTEWLQSIKSG